LQLYWARFDQEITENLYLSRGDTAFGWIASASDLARLMIKYQNIHSLRGDINREQLKTKTATPKTETDYRFDWCYDIARDWQEQFTSFGSTTFLLRSSSGLCWAILINTWRRGSPAFWPDLDQIVKNSTSDSTIRWPTAKH